MHVLIALLHTNLIVIDFKLKQLCSLSNGGAQGKHYTLMDLSVYGEHSEPNPIFLACYSHEA